MDAENWELRRAHFAAAHDADQAERRAVLMGASSMEDAALDQRISGELESEEGPQTAGLPEWERLNVQTEGLVGAALEEVERRLNIMEEAYPFELTEGGLIYRPSATGVYEVCLAASLDPMCTAEEYPKPTVIFEWVARDVLKLYIGSGSEGFRTGWPSDRRETRPRGTSKLFEELNSRCGDFVWRPRSYLPVRPKPRDLKDAGLDVVVWKHFGDRRTSILFALAQCACGRTDWETKVADLNLKRLANWFEGPTIAEPLRCFFVPFHIPNHAHLKEISGYAGLILDRARVTMVAEADVAAAQSIRGEALIDYHKAAVALLNAQMS